MGIIPNYYYRAIDRGASGNKEVKGVVAGETEQEVRQKLRGSGLWVTELNETFFTSEIIKQNPLVGLFKKKVKTSDLVVFCRQLAQMVEKGVPVYNGLMLLSENIEDKGLKTALAQVTQRLKEGKTLAYAFSEHPDLFPEIFIRLVEAGETGGVLDQTLIMAGDELEKQAKKIQDFKKALTEPAISLLVAVGVMYFMLTTVIPVFARMIKSSNGEMPVITKIVMELSSSIQEYSFFIFLLMFGASIAFQFALKDQNFRYSFDLFLIRIPIIGQLIVNLNISRFCRVFGVLIKAGVPFMKALDTAMNTISNKYLFKELMGAREKVEGKGKGLSVGLKSITTLKPMFGSMIAVGEESGSLEDMLLLTAKLTDDEVDTLLNRVVELTGPVVKIGIAAFVGLIVVASVLPMFRAMVSIGK